MLSPTRSAAQAVLKAVVTTASTVAQESTGASASASIEEKEESNDVDDEEPAKKKFKDDSETEVNDILVEVVVNGMLFRSKLLLRQRQFNNVHQKNEKFVFHSVIAVSLHRDCSCLTFILFRCWLFRSSTVKFTKRTTSISSVFFRRNAKDKVHRTIEDELVEAFVKVGAIPQTHADDMSKVDITSDKWR